MQDGPHLLMHPANALSLYPCCQSGFQQSRDIFTSQAITPADVREAMRRYGQCVGPFADFSVTIN